jgi:hypothetical protein
LTVKKLFLATVLLQSKPAGGALAAISDDFNGEAFDAEPLRRMLLHADRFDIFVRQINDSLAFQANHVMVRLDVGLHTRRPVMKTEFAQQSVLDKRPDVFVDRCERDGRNALLDLVVDGFRARMIMHFHQRLVDNLALVGYGKAMVQAKLPERIGWAPVHVHDTFYY